LTGGEPSRPKRPNPRGHDRSRAPAAASTTAHRVALTSPRPLHSPLPSAAQGPHWWDECPYPPKGACTAPPNGDFDGYIDLFADAAAKIRANPQVSVRRQDANAVVVVPCVDDKYIRARGNPDGD
jgi:hypothetical protein